MSSRTQRIRFMLVAAKTDICRVTFGEKPDANAAWRPRPSTQLHFQRNIVLTESDRFVWQKLGCHFKTNDLAVLVSSRRQFTAHLLADLQTIIEDLVAPWSPELLGFLPARLTRGC